LNSRATPPELLSSPSNWRLTELRGEPLGPLAQDKRAAFTDNCFTDGKVLKLHRARMAPLAVLEAVVGE
jgi:hypothetical protein